MKNEEDRRYKGGTWLTEVADQAILSERPSSTKMSRLMPHMGHFYIWVTVFPRKLPLASFFSFGEDGCPWANICCQSSSFCSRKIVAELTSVPIFLYFVCGTPPQCGSMSGVQVCTRDLNSWTLGHRSGAYKLNHYVTGLALRLRFLTKLVLLKNWVSLCAGNGLIASFILVTVDFFL